jgi:hypothetical protein
VYKPFLFVNVREGTTRQTGLFYQRPAIVNRVNLPRKRILPHARSFEQFFIFFPLAKKNKYPYKNHYNKKMRTQTMKKITCNLIFAMFLLTACSGGAKEEPTPTVITPHYRHLPCTDHASPGRNSNRQWAPTPGRHPTSASCPHHHPRHHLGRSADRHGANRIAAHQLLIAALASENHPDGTIVAKGATSPRPGPSPTAGDLNLEHRLQDVFQSGDLLGATSESVALTQNVVRAP